MSARDFWSRRKAAVEAEGRADEIAADAARADALESEFADRDDDEILAELGLAEPEMLESAQEVRAFIAEAVPQRLRARALRRLWTLNPTLANLDGLVDYGEDFTDAATVVENLQTVYQVGKGMFDRVVNETEPEAAEDVPPAATGGQALALEEDAPEDAGGDESGTETSVPDFRPGEAPQERQAQDAFVNEMTDDDAGLLPPASRRMRFRFEAAG